jgi:hypothetical protein
MGHKLVKICCEICGEADRKILHKHHIVERTDPNSTNDWGNICIICPNCHNKVHAKEIDIIGLFPSTKAPYGRTLVYERNGESNLPGVEEPPYKAEAKRMVIYATEDKE